MSRKSASVRLGALLMVRVCAMPYVVPRNQTRRLPAVPVVERVPLMVWRESKVTWVTPAADGAVTVRLLKVLED